MTVLWCMIDARAWLLNNSALFSCGINWFRGVVVITSALHAEGREFEPRRNLVPFVLFVLIVIYHFVKLSCTLLIRDYRKIVANET